MLTIWKEHLYKGPATTMDFIKTNNHTNIILVTIHPRYDLKQSSCMNSEIKSFNRKLKKMVNVYQRMSVLKMDNDRELFIHHGLHLNSQGREVLSKVIVSHTFSILEQKIDLPLIVNWKSDQNLTAPLNQVKSYKQNIYIDKEDPLNEI